MNKVITDKSNIQNELAKKNILRNINYLNQFGFTQATGINTRAKFFPLPIDSIKKKTALAKMIDYSFFQAHFYLFCFSKNQRDSVAYLDTKDYSHRLRSGDGRLTIFFFSPASVAFKHFNQSSASRQVQQNSRQHFYADIH